ncbi:MAG: hypothetical protein ACREH3_13015 [Geminicoccales bacterium]
MDNVSSLLKAFVIAGGIALLGGSVLLVVLIAMRAGQDPESARPAPAVTVGPVELALPAGARIVQMSTDGDRLVLLAENQAGHQFLAVVDALTGERLSLIRIRAGP